MEPILRISLLTPLASPGMHMFLRSVSTHPASILIYTSLLLGACAPAEDESANSTESTSGLGITGAGSTFAAPIIEFWIDAYKSLDDTVAISYDVVGSGEGIQQFLDSAVEVGATDAPLRLSREAYAGIFIGTIDRWDDPAIAADNTELDLPAKLIQLVARSDSSGTTYAFTEHLSAISPEWAKRPGSDKRIDWPGGTMDARGNEAVAGRVKLTLGSLEYVESGLANRLELPMALLENQHGEFVAPPIDAGQAAMASAKSDSVDQIAAAMIDPTGPDAYPILASPMLD